MKDYWIRLKPYILSWVTAFILALAGLGMVIWRLSHPSLVHLESKDITYDFLPLWPSNTGNPTSLQKVPTPQSKASVPVFSLKNTLPWSQTTPAKQGKIALILTHAGSLETSLETSPLIPEKVSLPIQVTLAFYGKGADITSFMAKARARGHECLKMVPMEPLDYPLSDPGAYPLLTGLSAKENIKRLSFHVEQSDMLMGITSFLGSRFMGCEDEVAPILQTLKQQSLAFIDLNSTLRSSTHELCKRYHMPCVKALYQLDKVQNPTAIERAWQQLQLEARQKGWAVGYAMATPFLLEKAKAWHAELANTTLEWVPLSVILKQEGKG